MNRGRFSKLRQKAYSVFRSAEIVTARSTFTARRAFTVAACPVTSLCDEALGFGSLDLAGCPRATLGAPPKPFKF